MAVIFNGNIVPNMRYGGTLLGASYTYSGGTGMPITLGEYNDQSITIDNTISYSTKANGTYGYATYEAPLGKQYDIKVAFPVIRGLSTDNNVLNMPKLLKLLKRYAAEAITRQLPPKIVEMVNPITKTFLHDDELFDPEIIAPAVRVAEKRAPVNPEDIYQVSESLDSEQQILTVHFRYFDQAEAPVIRMTVGEDLIRHFDRESNLERMRSIIKRRHKVEVKHSAKQAMPMTAIQAKELKARETLRDMITESEWRRYLTNGFIMVKAPSGLHYQIFGSRAHTKVYSGHELIESICIHTDSECPPSDHVINLKVLLEIDEEAVRKGGNISKLTAPRYTQLQMERAMANHIQGAANQGIIPQLAVDATNQRIDTATKLKSLMQSSESLVSIYGKLKSA